MEKTKLIKIHYDENVEITEVCLTFSEMKETFKSKKLGYTCIGNLTFYYDDIFKLNDSEINHRATNIFEDFTNNEDWLGGIVYIEKNIKNY